MLVVERIQSENFNSNVYLLTSSHTEEVFLIDCGSYQNCVDVLGSCRAVKGVFLTHYHYDHINYMEAWAARFPDLIFYGSRITLDGVSDPKKNMSAYYDNPVSFKPKNHVSLSDLQVIPLFDDVNMVVHETEGHCEGSLTFTVGQYIFTGDALIPKFPVVTKLRTGDKIAAKNSVKYIKSLCTEDSILCPGHFEEYSANEVNWNFYLSNV